jgi:hypothetical protein
MDDSLILSHWYTRLDTFSFSTQEFYERLCTEIARRQMPQIAMRRVALPEGNFLSSHRDYLRVTRGKFTFDLCAAPFGIDFFVSWWLVEQPGCLSGCLTAFLPWLAIFARKATYWEEDTFLMFRDAVHQCVIETVEGTLKAKDRTFEGDKTPITRKRLI